MVRREQYERLERHLREDGRDRIEMRIAEVSRIVGESLPASAYKWPVWWTSDHQTHTHAVWFHAGYCAVPDLDSEHVVFVREDC